MKEGESVRTHCARCDLLLPAGQRKWCNRKCQRGTSIKDPCPICGKDIPADSSRRKFCSQKCYWKDCDLKKLIRAKEQVEEKPCTKCKRVLPIEEFNNDGYTGDGHAYQCWQCQSEKSKKYADKSVGEARTDAYLRYTYNITIEEYQQIADLQNGRCAVCLKAPRGKRLAVDHDHRTKLVRGLLCMHCNLRIIGKLTDPEILRRAADYLESPPSVEALGEEKFAPVRRKKRQPRKRKR